MISRLFLAAMCLATSLFAGPPLTIIQDVLYKADGTRFNGTVTISWTSFEAIDRSAIAKQTTTVTVVNGYLQVQLVPTTTATPPAFSFRSHATIEKVMVNPAHYKGKAPKNYSSRPFDWFLVYSKRTTC